MNQLPILSAESSHARDWERMRQALWPSEPGEHAGEIRRYFEGSRENPAEVLIAFDDTGSAIGFVELSIRREAEECDSGRVAYIEGWWVDPLMRRKGVGAALVRAAEDWGRSVGCTEMASDTEIENEISRQAHESLGFDQVNRIICFRKSL